MPGDIQGLISDPEFKKLSPFRQRAMLEAAGAPDGFMDEYLKTQEIQSPSTLTDPTDRFVAGAWKNINPVSAIEGAYSALRHPLQTVDALKESMRDELRKADAAIEQGAPGGYVEAAGHTAAGLIPLIGPAAASAGEKIGSGDIAGGLGEVTGLLVPVGIPRAAEGAARLTGSMAPGVAEALERGAATRVADVMSPKVGANKVRLGNIAARVAPRVAGELAREGAPWTRGGLHAQVQAHLADATLALDEAADARLANQTFSAGDILRELQARRDSLTARSAGGGPNVVPAPNQARVAVLDQAINEVNNVVTRPRSGQVRVGYEPIRRIRQAYDSQARVVYNPSTTADFLRNRGGALGAADVAGVLREHLARWDPATARANAQYSLWRSVDDVLSATAEIERTRPKVGRQIMARIGGAFAGSQAGPAGAVAGWVAGPMVDEALRSGATTQLKTAALLQQLADAVRSGSLGRVNSVSHQLQRLAITGAVTTGNVVAGPWGQRLNVEPMPSTKAAEAIREEPPSI